MAVEDKKEEQDEIIPVGPGVEEESEQRPDSDKDKDQDEDDDDLDDEEEDGEETRLGSGEADDEEKRGARKDERKSRRSRQKEARARDQKELNYLRTDNARMYKELSGKLEGVEDRIGQSELAQIDGRINQLKTQIKSADTVIARSIDQRRGEDATEAQGIRDTLRDNLGRLEQAKEILTQRAPRRNAEGGGEQGRGPDPRLLSHANTFMQKHEWWDPEGGDEDSVIVSAIDYRLAQEGFDPTKKEYWTELEKRVQRRLPHQFEDNKDEGGEGKGRRKVNGKGQGGGGPRFRTGGRERPLKSNEVYVSPERKEAMIEAGVWEDPVLRQRYLKAYSTHDREHGSNN